MKLFNIMLGRKNGGIEQAFLDYADCLTTLNPDQEAIEVINIISKGAKVESQAMRHPCLILNPIFGDLDIISILQLRGMIKKHNPDFIICHGNRANKYAYVAAKGLSMPVIGVAHRYSLKTLVKLDYCFAITKDIRDQLQKDGMNKEKIFHIPNMINHQITPSLAPNKQILGVIGRLHSIKGQDIFIHALSHLHHQLGIKAHAILAGDGDNMAELKQLAMELNLIPYINFIGWVADKNQFYDKIDLLIIPSREESFSITVLEGWAAHRPIISSKSKGPSALIQDQMNGILVEKENPIALAMMIAETLNNPSVCKTIVENGKASLIPFQSKSIGLKIRDALHKITQKK